MILIRLMMITLVVENVVSAGFAVSLLEPLDPVCPMSLRFVEFVLCLSRLDVCSWTIFDAG